MRCDGKAGKSILWIDLSNERRELRRAAGPFEVAIELAEKAGNIGELGELEQRVKEDPKNFQARFDLAIALAGRGERSKAADELIEILRVKRDWNEGAAKTQLLQFFEAWGFDDDASVSGRKKLSSLLFA